MIGREARLGLFGTFGIFGVVTGAGFRIRGPTLRFQRTLSSVSSVDKIQRHTSPLSRVQHRGCYAGSEVYPSRPASPPKQGMRIVPGSAFHLALLSAIFHGQNANLHTVEADLKKQRKFLLGGVAVVGLVSYLMVTGMRDSMVYYHTPAELVAKVSVDPDWHDLGVKVGGRVTPGTVSFDQRTLDLRFEVFDIESGAARFPVHFQGPLPETFEEGSDVVIEGRFTREGVFEASTLLTKCGSRYEAGAEDFLS